MVANISFNPLITTNAAGTFVASSDGVVQGTFYDDPAVRYALRGGILATTETLPMWGGVGVYELVPTPGTPNPDISLGSILGRATTLTQTSTGGLTGFTVFNQAINMVTTPQSTVPLSGTGMSCHYFRLGSGARIAVAADPVLVDLEGGLVGANVSWDFNNQRLQPYDASTATYSVTSMTWSSTNGGQIAVVMAVASPVGAVGDAVNISGATNTGTGGNSVVNGNFTVNTFTDNEHFTVLAPAASGVYGTIAGTIVLNYGTGALACRIDRVYNGTAMTVSYNSVTGYATWNYGGTAVVIQI
jgi:hypothetical protein